MNNINKTLYLIIFALFSAYPAAARDGDMTYGSGSESEINNLIQSKGYIRVTSTPTLAAMHYEWVQLSVFVILSILLFFRFLKPPQTWGKLDMAFVVTSAIMFPIWIAGFIIIHIHPIAEAGWSSCLGWFALATLLQDWYSWEKRPFSKSIYYIMHVILAFWWVGSLYLIIARFGGFIGTVAYKIISLNGCSAPDPNDRNFIGGIRGMGLLAGQIGLFVGISIFSLLRWCPETSFGSRPGIKTKWLLWTYVVTLVVYWSVITALCINLGRLGSPYVVSGNCILVELDPRLSFYDSIIPTYWKVLMAFFGLW